METKYVLLVKESGSGSPRRVVLTTGEYLLGRNERNHLVLAGDSVSRHHAKLVVADAGVTLMDLASTQGTFVNGRRVLRRELTPSDVFQVGDYELRFEEREKEPAESPGAGSPETGPDTDKMRRPVFKIGSTSAGADAAGSADDEFNALPTTRPLRPFVPGAKDGAGAGEAKTKAQERAPDTAQAATVDLEVGAVVEAVRKKLAESGASPRPAPPEAGAEPAPASTEETSNPFAQALGEKTTPMDFPTVEIEGPPPTLPSTATPASAGDERAGVDPVSPDDDLPTAVTADDLSTVPENGHGAPDTQDDDEQATIKRPRIRLRASTVPMVQLVDDELGSPAQPPTYVRSLGAEVVTGPAAAEEERLLLHQLEVLDAPNKAGPPAKSAPDVVGYLVLLQRLLEVAYSSSEPKELYERSFELLWPKFSADVGVLFELGETRVPTPTLVRTRERIPPGEVPVSRTVVDRILRDRIAMRCEDLRHDQRFEAGASLFLYNVRSVVAAPIVGVTGIAGILYLHRGPGASFDERDLDRLVSVSQLISLGIDRLAHTRRADPAQLLRRLIASHLPPEAAATELTRLADSAKRGDGLPSFTMEPIRVVAFCAAERGSGVLRRALEDEELASRYGEVFQLVAEAMRREHAIVVSEGGDALLALFPVEGKGARHALQRAVRAALALRTISATKLQTVRGAGLGVGLELGVADAGFVPVGERVMYCAVGPPVTAARLLAARTRPGEILVSTSLRAALDGIVRTVEVSERTAQGEPVYGVPSGAVVVTEE